LQAAKPTLFYTYGSVAELPFYRFSSPPGEELFVNRCLSRVASACPAILFFAAPLVAVTSPAAANDPSAGKAVFQNTCTICHSAQQGQNKIGPTLFGIVGRKTNSVEGYSYSAANQNANITWNTATLDKYLEAPRAMIPGTKMSYTGMKDSDKRADLVTYLTTLK
jgi:cytochrome c